MLSRASLNGLLLKPTFRAAPRRAASASEARSAAELVTRELHHKTKLGLPKERLDVANNPGMAADRDPLTDLKRLLAAEVAGRNHLIAAPKLVPVVRHRSVASRYHVTHPCGTPACPDRPAPP